MNLVFVDITNKQTERERALVINIATTTTTKETNSTFNSHYPYRMGAGCSSPLRRLGGKRGKPTQRDSVSVDALGNNDSQEQFTIAARLQAQQQPSQKLTLENEITIQSEINEDHPSTASYYTDGKNQFEDAQHRQVGDQEPGDARTATSKLFGAGAAAAKMMGLSGSYVPHDRHLLVSPALSPAPSLCQSPATASSHLGYSILDLNDLNEAFKTLTFGFPDDQLKQRIKQPERPQSEMHNYYTQQIIQSQNDLINYVSVIFFTTDDSVPLSENEKGQSSSIIDTLINQIESNLSTLCDEHSFNLRFLNLSQSHLSKCFRINNLQDVAMRIFEQEYQENSQRLIVIILANNNSNVSGISFDTAHNENFKQQLLDNRQLPTKIDAQIMNKLLNSEISFEHDAKTLLKQWYNQVGNSFYLNPIYLVNSKILSESKEERERAWQSWLKDSCFLITALTRISDNNQEFASAIAFKSIFGSYIDFITKETSLQKRTLLIRNYPHSGNILSNQQQQPQIITATNKIGSLNDLARILADPNKLTLKRILTDDEFLKTINDWVFENFNKYLQNFLESRIVHGKYVPPFIERNLFIELTFQRHYLEYYLDNTTESYESKCYNFYTSQIQPMLSGFIDGTVASSNEPATTLINSESRHSLASQPSMNHLVLISGPRGCGKTTLFAQIIRFIAQDLFNKAQIIYRFCGLTMDSFTPNRLLRSICEQFCQTQGENITAASYIYSARREVMNSLNKIINQQNSIILLDGMDSFEKPVETSFDWLCEIEANPRIKIIIMLETDSELYKKVLSSYSDATYISLDNPTMSEWAQMLTSTARSRRFNSASNFYDEIKNFDSTGSAAPNITYSDVSDILHMCRIRRLNNEFIYPELTSKIVQNNSIQGLKNIQQTIFTHLHYLISPYQLCSLVVAFDSSRCGLSERDIINIMNLISQHKHTDIEQVRFSSSSLSYLKIQMQPWLRYVICDKTVRVSIRKDFLAKAVNYYVPKMFPKIIGEVREILLDYYSRPLNQCRKSSKMIGTGDGSPGEFRDRANPTERMWIGTQASETMNLLILTDPSKARDHIMRREQFYLQFLHRSAPEEFIEDYERLKAISGRKLSHNEELQHLVNYIRQSIFPLRYDGSQIYSQIYCRAFEHYKTGKFSKSKKFNDILTLASCPPIRNLLPISELSIDSFIKTRIGLNQPPTNSISTSSLGVAAAISLKPTVHQKPPQSGQISSQQQAKQRIFTIKDNHRHVIVIYPDKGNLSVWDIFEEKAVRTISNIDQPRDLRMIDQKRAVILCNRELRVYDLDSGSMLTKLKGVMNQKMPFFEVFDENYVVALARNRMYVNMLNLNTGELETTFKVGEDRFLNSLLVSANGGICVCGDETQKPFPLLVWNLNERRLMYDLRLDRHEFITRMSAISDDGHFVVSVCKQIGDTSDSQLHGSSSGANSGSTSSFTGALGHKSSPNFIVIYDLNSGTLFKKWKPGLDTCGVAISLSANRSGKVINTIVDSTILVWDLATGSKK